MTSDLHGCWRRLDRLLRHVGFCDNDMLFILGNLIEKGRENLASLRYVMKLSQRDNVTVLMGNVDLSRLEMLECLREESSKKLYEYLLKMRGWRGTSIFDEMGGGIRHHPGFPGENLCLQIHAFGGLSPGIRLYPVPPHYCGDHK